ncbi:hypothetical protein [Klebsiella grimontii]|jgi:hypothetical protein|uniref:hypothetical protein n=1 Tax=Klebsiella grimontii TaxID=2058152 RepID=UPI002FCBAB1B
MEEYRLNTQDDPVDMKYFVRFKKAGLVWPLPLIVEARKLDKCLYRQGSRKG